MRKYKRDDQELGRRNKQAILKYLRSINRWSTVAEIQAATKINTLTNIYCHCHNFVRLGYLDESKVYDERIGREIFVFRFVGL